MYNADNYLEDNTFEKVDRDVYYCDECQKDTEHINTSGQTIWDSYSYSTCTECGFKS